MLLALIFYLSLYYSSFFTQPERFSTATIVIYVISLLGFNQLVRFYLKKATSGGKRPSKVRHFLAATGMVLPLHLLIHYSKKSYWIYFGPQWDRYSYLHLFSALTEGLIIAIIIVSFQFLIQYLKVWKKEIIRSQSLEKENAMARMAALSNQINPHFLFNNFNTLQGLIHEDPDEADRFLMELAELYRFLLSYHKEEVVPLKKELEVIRHFNFLLQKRFHKSYSCQVDLEEADKNGNFVPPLALQLLLENAVKHNQIDKAHRLVCRLFREGPYLVVRNNRHPKHQTYHSSGIGLKNLITRYEFLSPLPVKIEEKNDCFTVKIPLIQTGQDEYSDH